MFAASTCVRCSSSPPFTFFCLSVTNIASCRDGVTGGPCERPSRYRQASQGARCCSGHVCRKAPQRLHFGSLVSPTPASLLARSASLIHPPPNCFSSLCRRYWKPGAAGRIPSAAFEELPEYWFGPESPAGSPGAAPGFTGLKESSLLSFP